MGNCVSTPTAPVLSQVPHCKDLGSGGPGVRDLSPTQARTCDRTCVPFETPTVTETTPWADSSQQRGSRFLNRALSWCGKRGHSSFRKMMSRCSPPAIFNLLTTSRDVTVNLFSVGYANASSTIPAGLIIAGCSNSPSRSWARSRDFGKMV